MITHDDIILTKTDFEKISALINSAPSAISQLLEEELGRALLVADDKLPEDVVAMNSIVSFEDLEGGKTSLVVLVYPHEANISESKISILTPVGSALIGLRVGQSIRWPLPNGREKRLKVISVQQAKIDEVH